MHPEYTPETVTICNFSRPIQFLMKNILCFLVCALFVIQPVWLTAQTGRTPAPAKNGMVVSSHYAASEAGKQILRQGGNAIDAAVATAFALAVTLPSAGNIGGGGFIVYHGGDGEVTCFNFREKAPLAATRTCTLARMEK